jgi:centrosomal protein CEP76
VSLFSTFLDPTVGEDGGIVRDQWASLHAILVRGAGSPQDHAALLCSILLGFGMDAWVGIGMTRILLDGMPGAMHRASWVLTRETSCVNLWDPVTGTCKSLPLLEEKSTPDSKDGGENYNATGTTLDCVFNDRAFCANIQHRFLCEFFYIKNSCVSLSLTPSMPVLC